MKHFDVIWIGTGQATFTVVPRLAAAGKSIAIIEGGKFGGTCVNHGCTPTKTLVASAYAVHLARRGNDFGFSVDGLSVNFASVMETQQANRASSSSGIENGLEAYGQILKGYAEFNSENSIVVNGQELSADMFIVHTGTRPSVPDVSGIDSVSWLNNESLLDLTECPRHLVIVGGSYIALEFAQIFRRLGSEVTVLQRGPRLVSREDEDVSQIVEQVLADEGIRVLCDSTVESVSNTGGVAVNVVSSGESHTIAASHLLFATGRVPNSDRLKAAAAGIKLSSRGFIEVNEVMQTSVPHIYAIGDVNGRVLSHTHR